MYTLLKPLIVREELLKRRLYIFTLEEFTRVFNTKAHKTKYFLETQTDQGLFIRLKKGLYTLKTDIPAEEEIANALYRPSYISFEYALAYYNIIPEMQYQITSATTKPTRLFTVLDKEFVYYTLKKKAYTGYRLVKTEAKSFFMAEPEKALVDYIYFISLGKKPHNNRLILKDINKEKLFKYGELFGRKSLIDLLKNTYVINR